MDAYTIALIVICVAFEIVALLVFILAYHRASYNTRPSNLIVGEQKQNTHGYNLISSDITYFPTGATVPVPDLSHERQLV